MSSNGMPDAISRQALTRQLLKKKSTVADKRYTEGFNDAIMRARSMVHAAPSLGSYVRWISVKDKQPAPFVSVQVYMTDAGNFPPVREGYIVDDGLFYIPALKEVHPGSHWTELATPPEVQDE